MSFLKLLLGGFSVAALTATPNPLFGKWGFDTAAVQPSVRPGDDFYRFANGAWLDSHSIPAGRPSIGSFPDVRYSADEKVRALLDSHATDHASRGDPDAKLGALYRAFLDERRVDALGATPLAADLRAIRAARSRNDVASLMGEATGGFHASIFQLEVGYDQTEPSRFAVRLGQGGLTLPDRDYYLEPRFGAQLSALQAYAGRMLALAGWPNPEVSAAEVVRFETRVAEASWADADVRDSRKNVRPRDIRSIVSVSPQFPWRPFMRSAGLAGVSRVISVTDGSLPKIAAVFADTPVETLKAWEAFRTADAAAPYLSRPFVDASFAFHGQALSGRQTAPPRWRGGVELVNTEMGSQVGRLYVARYLSPDAKLAMERMVANLRGVLRERITSLTWMGSATKVEALKKLDAQRVQVGYPNRWRDYNGLAVVPDDLVGDVRRGRAFEWRRRVAQVGQPWDPAEWRFWPQYPTAYAENRELIFTAALLQPPFYDPQADPAVNYGAAGAVIGHELTHNYDDRGRQEDAEVKLRDWWTPEDASRFKARADRLSHQFSAMEPLPGLHIKGDVTLGENIADLGGLKIAIAAYHASLHGQPAPTLDGFSGDQRVFLGWAQVWRERMQPEALRRQITSDLHSPATARVNGIVRNIDEWYDAFNVGPGSALYLAPSDRVRIW